MLLLYTAIVLPWRVAFGKRGMHAWDSSSPLSILKLFIDLFFFADMARSARTAYHEEVSGDLVTSSKAVARRYLRGWFALDLIATFPYDWLLLALQPPRPNAPQLINALLLLRVIKLTRLLRLVRLLRMTSKRGDAKRRAKASASQLAGLLHLSLIHI